MSKGVLILILFALSGCASSSLIESSERKEEIGTASVLNVKHANRNDKFFAVQPEIKLGAEHDFRLNLGGGVEFSKFNLGSISANTNYSFITQKSKMFNVPDYEPEKGKVSKLNYEFYFEPTLFVWEMITRQPVRINYSEPGKIYYVSTDVKLINSLSLELGTNYYYNSFQSMNVVIPVQAPEVAATFGPGDPNDWMMHWEGSYNVSAGLTFRSYCNTSFNANSDRFQNVFGQKRIRHSFHLRFLYSLSTISPSYKFSFRYYENPDLYPTKYVWRHQVTTASELYDYSRIGVGFKYMSFIPLGKKMIGGIGAEAILKPGHYHDVTNRVMIAWVFNIGFGSIKSI